VGKVLREGVIGMDVFYKGSDISSSQQGMTTHNSDNGMSGDKQQSHKAEDGKKAAGLLVGCVMPLPDEVREHQQCRWMGPSADKIDVCACDGQYLNNPWVKQPLMQCNDNTACTCQTLLY